MSPLWFKISPQKLIICRNTVVQELENTGSFAAILKLNVLLQMWALKQGSTAGLEVSSHGYRITCVLKTQHNLKKWSWRLFQVRHKFAMNESKTSVTILTGDNNWQTADKKYFVLTTIFDINDTQKMNLHMKVAKWYDLGLIKCVVTQ